jgi:3-phenylpropionate/trans-cinnamate dioxygenase ferredoxin reductase subunit
MNGACVVVGASHAGAQLAASLRRHGWTGRIVLVGDEACLPYHRPPLSKQYLSGEKGQHEILIRPQAAYAKMDVHLTLGVKVEAIDRARRTAALDNGEDLHYDKLALTVGARPRRIPIHGSELENVFYLRNQADVDRIRACIGSHKRAVIIGGGYIGLEAAAALRSTGMAVTVLEACPRVLQRVTAPQVSAFYHRVHGEQGVEVVVDTCVERIDGSTAAEAVACTGGRCYPADLVIIAVGVVPNTELAASAGLAVGDGIVVDECACTSDPDIVAAGDCTWHYNSIYARHLRLESVQNAHEQASVAAATLCGKREPLPRAAVVLVGSVRSQAPDRRAVAGSRSGDRPRRHRARPQLRRLLHEGGSRARGRCGEQAAGIHAGQAHHHRRHRRRSVTCGGRRHVAQGSHRRMTPQTRREIMTETARCR